MLIPLHCTQQYLIVLPILVLLYFIKKNNQYLRTVILSILFMYITCETYQLYNVSIFHLATPTVCEVLLHCCFMRSFCFGFDCYSFWYCRLSFGRFAGAPLCNQGLDYRRDAGHGASCIVSVRDIGVRSRFNETSIAAGMAFIGETVCYEDVTIRISASIGLESATISPLGISLSGVELLIEEGLATVSFFLRKIAVQI